MNQQGFDYLNSNIKNAIGVAALLGNVMTESGCNSNNLQNNGNSRLGMSDTDFTAAVDSGLYSKARFISDSFGYGLCQWTTSGRKQQLYEYVKEQRNGSIGNESLQLEFLVLELQNNYKSVWNVLCGATSIQQASDAVLTGFERPKDQSSGVQAYRASLGQQMYNAFANKSVTHQSQDGHVQINYQAGQGYKILTNLNVRSGPGEKFPVIDTLNKDKVADQWILNQATKAVGNQIWMYFGMLNGKEQWVCADTGESCYVA